MCAVWALWHEGCKGGRMSRKSPPCQVFPGYVAPISIPVCPSCAARAARPMGETVRSYAIAFVLVVTPFVAVVTAYLVG